MACNYDRLYWTYISINRSCTLDIKSNVVFIDHRSVMIYFGFISISFESYFNFSLWYVSEKMGRRMCFITELYTVFSIVQRHFSTFVHKHYIPSSSFCYTVVNHFPKDRKKSAVSLFFGKCYIFVECFIQKNEIQ